MKKLAKKAKNTLKKQIANLRYRLAFENCRMDFATADERLRAFHPMPASSALTHHEIMDPEYDLTIIVPAYNAEKWIGQCLDSILNQETKYSYLLKVINDGSTDGTDEILKQYSKNSHVQVINQENRGYSGARNRGLERINSSYIMFVDSDDHLLPGAIEQLLSKAFSGENDIVEGNGYRFDENGVIGPVRTKGSKNVTGVPWMKVFRAKLFEHIQFPEGYLYEDKVIGSLVIKLVKKKEIIPDNVYTYRIHPGSITQSHDDNPRRLDSYWIMWLMQEEQEKLGIKTDYHDYVRAMRQIVMTYRRTVFLPEEIKKAIFAGSRHFIETYYSSYTETDDKCRKLTEALLAGHYGKYRVFCENHMI